MRNLRPVRNVRPMRGVTRELLALAAFFVAMLGAGWAWGSARAQEGRRRPAGEAPAAPVSSGAARHASLTEGLDCANCHTTESWAMAGGSGAGRGFDHARTGFPLTGHHALETCASCHRPGAEIRRECVSCHVDDHHEGRVGRDCDRCHTSTTWNDTNSLEIHRRTRLPLTGMHALVACTECHGRVGEREYTAPPADCFACHERDYRRSDVHPVHSGSSGAEPFPRDCAQCHVASGWSPALFDPTAAATGALTVAPAEHEVVFPIRRGPHRGTPCTSCHIAAEMPQIVECTGCHVHDPVTLQRQHGGMAVAPDAASCLGCHPGGMGR